MIHVIRVNEVLLLSVPVQLVLSFALFLSLGGSTASGLND
jgi:hypothetical protein